MTDPVAEKKILKGCQAALGKKATDLIVFDLRGISALADYFLICSATNEKQVQAIAGSIETALLEDGIKMDHKEGYEESTWILLDYGDLIVHIFTENKRQYYALEHLWGDAPQLDLSPLINGEEKKEKNT